MNLYEIAELVYKQLQPTSGGQPTVHLEEFKSSARAEFAYQSLLLAWKEKKDEGFFTVPSYLLKTVDKAVENNQIDISDLNYFKSLPNEVWLQDLGGNKCDCRFVKSTINNNKLLCGDDSMDDEAISFYIVGNKIIFPQGIKGKKTLPITYANKGEDVNGNIEVADSIAAIVRERLIGLYLGKVAQNDETNNSNSNN